MPAETHEGHSQGAPVLLAWGGSPGEASDSMLDGMLMWAAGSAGLLLWTGFALLLTG
jgi:hypothetical protein